MLGILLVLVIPRNSLFKGVNSIGSVLKNEVLKTMIAVLAK